MKEAIPGKPALVVLDKIGDYLMKPEEAAKRLGCNRSFVKELIDAKLLPVLIFGCKKRISCKALNKFIEDFAGVDLIELVKRTKQVAG